MNTRAAATVLVALLSSVVAGQALACSATTPCINEVLADVPGGPGANLQAEYIEFRSPSGDPMPANTYFVAIEGDFQTGRNQGSVDSIINVSGLTFGSNGFLVLLQQGNTYTVAPGAAVLTSTSAGFGGLPGGIWQGDEGAVSYERPSTSFFLVTAPTDVPLLSDDIDADDDGVIDATSFLAAADAVILDSVGIADNPQKDRSYAAINFRTQDDGSPTTIVIAGKPSYIGRYGDSFGSSPAAWAASTGLGGANPNWLLNATVVYPNGIQGKPLNHIGTTNAWLNLAPEVNIDPAASTLEDAPLTYAGNLSITDTDSAGGTELVAIAVTNGTLSLSGTAGLAFTAGDGTGDAAMTFSGTVVAINTALNNAVFTPAPEFSGDATVTVNVNDQGNTGVPFQALSDEETQTITVGAVNDPPVVANQAFTVSEDAADGTAVGTVVATDAENETLAYSITTVQTDFAIDSATGAITVATGAALDFETTPSYTLTVEVSDGTTPTSATITIDVIDVNDNGPVIPAGQVFTIPENAPNGSAVSPGPVQATDPDNDTLTYSFATPSSAFAIIATTGQIVVANTQLIDFETTPSFTLSVAVTDGVNSTTESVTVDVIDVASSTPVVHDQTFAVNENAPNGTIVGAVFAVDEDGPSLTYSINPASTAFTINPANGQISVADSAQLDFETTPQFVLTVEVSDGTSSDTATITINVNDIVVEDPAPSVVSIDRLGANPATSSPVQFTVTFSETVNGVDSSDFSIPVSGTVTGAAITALNCTNATCTVTVGFSGANGTLGLDLVDDDSIVDTTAQPLGGAGAGNGDFTGQVFDIDTDGAGDTTPPVVNSVVRANPSPSPGPTVDFIVSFSEAVTGVDVGDFQLTVTGSLVTPSISGVSGSGSTYTVTVATGTGIGTIRLDVVDDDSVIDGESNPLGGAGTGNGAFTTGEVYSIDTINPILIFKDGFEDPPAP